MKILRNVGLALILASNLNCKKEASKKYEFDLDELTPDMAGQLYSLAHDGQEAQYADELLPYEYSSIDLNDNGVLDYHLEYNITERGGKIVGVYQKIVYRKEANGLGFDFVQEDRLVVNGDGTYTLYSSQNSPADEAMLNELASRYANTKRNMEETDRLLRQMTQGN